MTLPSSIARMLPSQVHHWMHRCWPSQGLWPSRFKMTQSSLWVMSTLQSVTLVAREGSNGSANPLTILLNRHISRQTWLYIIEDHSQQETNSCRQIISNLYTTDKLFWLCLFGWGWWDPSQCMRKLSFSWGEGNACSIPNSIANFYAILI